MTLKKGMKDKVEGSFHEAKGLVKEVAGKLTGQMDLEIAGVLLTTFCADAATIAARALASQF